MRIRRPIFEYPITDEVKLEQQSKSLLKTLSSPPTKEELLILTKTHSVELATRCFYDGIKQSEHRKMIDEINFQNVKPQDTNPDLTLYIVPGMFYKEHPEAGTDGHLAKEIAKKFGFNIKFIETDSRGSIAANAKLIKNQLEKNISKKVWVISISKGSCDVRRYLQCNEKPTNLVGWIDIAGIHKGIPFINEKFNTVYQRIYLQFLSLIFRVEYSTLKELRTTEKEWRNHDWPKDIDVIHVIPVPIKTHIHQAIMRRYKQTLMYGPNDGFVPLVDALDMPGNLYPLWGCDHFLRSHELSALLHKLFNYIASKNE